MINYGKKMHEGGGAQEGQNTLLCRTQAKRREGLSVQRLADLANLPHAGCGGFRA